MDVDLLDRRLGLSLHCEIEEAKKRLLELWAERGKGVCGEGRGGAWKHFSARCRLCCKELWGKKTKVDCSLCYFMVIWMPLSLMHKVPVKWKRVKKKCLEFDTPQRRDDCCNQAKLPAIKWGFKMVKKLLRMCPLNALIVHPTELSIKYQILWPKIRMLHCLHTCLSHEKRAS